MATHGEKRLPREQGIDFRKPAEILQMYNYLQLSHIPRWWYTPFHGTKLQFPLTTHLRMIVLSATSIQSTSTFVRFTVATLHFCLLHLHITTLDRTPSLKLRSTPSHPFRSIIASAIVAWAQWIPLLYVTFSRIQLVNLDIRVQTPGKLASAHPMPQLMMPARKYLPSLPRICSGPPESPCKAKVILKSDLIVLWHGRIKGLEGVLWIE